MSSEESTTSRSSSSRLSQFGLYRTIDARTEEFLKLSKKRQIRQGCACAVISTALTVTIVVVVFLIYEYNGYSDTNPEKELFNKTTNITKNTHKEKSRHEGNNGKFSKKKHIISTSTINLLNLLLKALNHTHNLEGQEKKAYSPNIEKLDATNTPFKRNVFSGIKNWVRIPNLRMLAEHKAPSIFYYRNPTTNLKLATNTRKPSIYAWTDISEASEEVLEKSPTSIVKTDHPRILTTMETITLSKKYDRYGQKIECNCSKLSQFLSKLLSNFQELFPGIILNTTLCSFNRNVNIKKPYIRTSTASTTLDKVTNSKTTFALNDADKNKAAEKKYLAEVWESVKPVVNIYKEYKKSLLPNTNKLERANKIETTQNSLEKSTKTPLENHLQTVFKMTKEPEFTTEPLQPYIVAPELVEYLKYFIKSTTAATRNKSETQHKILEKIHMTNTLGKYIDRTGVNKDNTKYLVTNIHKSAAAIKTYQHETYSTKKAAKIHESVTLRNFVAANTNKKSPKNILTNMDQFTYFRKSGNENYQNKKNKINSKSPMQSVIKTLKVVTEMPEYTTVTVRPYIVAPEPIEYTVKSTTTSTAATIVKYHKIEQNIDIKNVLNGTTRNAERTTQEVTLTAAATKKKWKTEQNFGTEKTLKGAIRSTETKIHMETSTTATESKHARDYHNADFNNVFDETIASIEITTHEGTLSAATAAKHDIVKQNLNLENALDQTIKSTETASHERTSTVATELKHYTTEPKLDKEPAIDETIKITEKTAQKEAILATSTMQHDIIEQNLDFEKALDDTIRSIEKMTLERTSTDATSKECDKTKPNLYKEEVLDDSNKRIDITMQEETSKTDSNTKHNKIEHILDTEKALDKTMRNTVKAMETKTVTKYFKDDFYEVNKPFKDIKFARFDSFAANSNKHMILPSYKDLNFELFPVFKRHNTNTPKFDTNRESYNDSRMDNDFTEIMSSCKKDSVSNEIIDTVSSGNHDTTNKIHIPSSSVITEETSPANWIFEIKMMNDKAKETLQENINWKNLKQNSVLRKSEESENPNTPEKSSIADKYPIWTYNIEHDFAESTTPKLKLENNLDKYETTKTTVMKIFLPVENPSEINTNKQSVSINQLYDTNKSLLKYLNKTTQLKTNGTNKNQFNISNSEEFTFFEDRIQEKLKFLRDTKSKTNNNLDVTSTHLMPSEIMADVTEYNPSSMLPKSRPSYLEINRNFLNIDEDQDYQLNKVYYKQKRPDYDYVYDILK